MEPRPMAQTSEMLGTLIWEMPKPRSPAQVIRAMKSLQISDSVRQWRSVEISVSK